MPRTSGSGSPTLDEVARVAGVSRATANKTLKRLVETQWLVREGTIRNATYKPGLLRQVVQRYSLAGLSEDVPWSRDFAPYFNLPDNCRRIAQHAFGELVNNAIDHSGGTQVTVSSPAPTGWGYGCSNWATW